MQQIIFIKFPKKYAFARNVEFYKHVNVNVHVRNHNYFGPAKIEQ
jgi:hypothetical protein